MDQMLWYLFAGSRGGPNRLRIVELLRDRPYNAHQLAELTELDYRTVSHHLDVLVRHHVLVSPDREAYGAQYFLSGLAEAAWPTVAKIKLRSSPVRARAAEQSSNRSGGKDGPDSGEAA